MLDTTFILAAAKLTVTLGVMLILLRRQWKLWQAILAGCIIIATMAAFSGVPLLQLIEAPLITMQDTTFLFMEIMIFGILMLSGLQGATGQSQRLVEALDRYLRWPRLRLVIFPALVGLLPMPGGALFSCPMLDAAAHGIEVSGERKCLINYWFRHIWETSWPLYPGFILLCSLLGVPMHTLIKFTLPFVCINFFVGWVFYIRDIEVTEAARTTSKNKNVRHPFGLVIYESLPITITIVGAGVFGVILSRHNPELPSQLAFVASLFLAIVVARWQGRKYITVPMSSLAMNRRTASMLALIFMVFIFKDIIGVSGIVAEMSNSGGSIVVICLLTILLPLICGMLMGVMVGYVGAAFPIILGLIAEAGLQAYTVPIIMLGLSAGQIGQLASPLHICLVVTCEYYKVDFMQIWKELSKALVALILGGSIWVLFLYLMGARL